jgi:hypothetical protein
MRAIVAVRAVLATGSGAAGAFKPVSLALDKEATTQPSVIVQAASPLLSLRARQK